MKGVPYKAHNQSIDQMQNKRFVEIVSKGKKLLQASGPNNRIRTGEQWSQKCGTASSRSKERGNILEY